MVERQLPKLHTGVRFPSPAHLHENRLKTKEMKTKTIAVSLGLIFVAGGLYAADPFDGTWKLNESKSKLVQGTDKDTKIVYNSHSVPDKVTVTADGVEGDGTPIHTEWKGKFDGKDYAVTGDPDADKRSYTKMNDRTLSMTAKKGNEVVAQGLLIVSADGKSQDITLISPDDVMSVYSEKGKEKKRRKLQRNRRKKGLGTRPFTTKNNSLGPPLILTGDQVNVCRLSVTSEAFHSPSD